jgi:Uncharacterized protein family UPF0016
MSATAQTIRAIRAFLIATGLMDLAEIGDKTQIATVALTAPPGRLHRRRRRHVDRQRGRGAGGGKLAAGDSPIG